MKVVHPLFAFAFPCLAAALFLGGCASTDVDLNGESVSYIPWNRPQSWETGHRQGHFHGGDHRSHRHVAHRSPHSNPHHHSSAPHGKRR